MYPLTLIRISKNRKIDVELKNNEIYEGSLIECDLMMNMHLKNVSVKTTDGRTYFLLDCFLKGSLVKYVKLNPGIMNVQDVMQKRSKTKKKQVK